MRAASVAKVFPQQRDAEGNPLCRFCRGSLPKGRRTFCSDSCVTEALLRCNPGTAREAVRKRDAGVCAECGIDTERLGRALGRARRVMSRRRLPERVWRALSEAVRPELRWAADRMLRRWPGMDHLWEADHIVPVAKGGGLCGLENLQTLCIACHGRKSGQQRRRPNPQLEIVVSA